MDFIDYVAIFVLILGTERWAQAVMVGIGVVFLLFGHWLIAFLFWLVTFVAWKIGRGY